MLFYTQIKKEFSQICLKRGQLYFREDRVSDVKLDGSLVTAKVRGSQAEPYETCLTMARGTIIESDCTCNQQTPADPHCKHVAALAVWIIERGSLLRAGINETSYGISTQSKRPQEPEELSSKDSRPEPIPGEPVLYVRGSFQGKVFSSLIVETAIRYVEPATRKSQIHTMTFLTKQKDPEIWKTTQGILLRVPAPKENDMIQVLDGEKTVYSGQDALENLARYLSKKESKFIVIDPEVRIPLDPKPLKLVSLSIGSKTDKSRALSYVFENSSVRLSSTELEELSKLGHLSNQYVWKGERIYQFETPLSKLHQYSNKSGTSAADGDDDATKMAGFGLVRDDSEHPLHPLAAFRLSLELGVKNFKVDPEWKEFHEWKANFDKNKLPPLPKVKYGFKLRAYQRNGLSWLWSLYHRGLAALLADDMGLGKTHQVLALLTTLYRGKRPRIRQPSLVVAPTSVITAWVQKLKKYDTGLKWHVFHGSGRSLPDSGVDLILTTYGILHREPDLREKDWHVVILDEAQAIKNASTISSRASRVLRSKFRIAMTGTPVENHATDLWSLMDFLLPGYLGSLQRFKRLYGWDREPPAEHQAAALRRLVTPFLLRRTKAKVLKELPEKTEEVIHCDMTPAQKKAYRNCLNSSDATRIRENLSGSGKIDYANILALLTRLKQICDHPKLADFTSGKVKKVGVIDPLETGKWEAFDELVSEALRSDLKVVVFTQYLGMMDIIGHYLKKRQIGFTDIRGDTADRSARLDKFANEPDCRVFVCSLLAGGLGIDLTAGSVCIHFDRWWNPAKENQATDRLHRYGQTRGVQVFKLQIPGSVEDRIASIIQSKIQLSGTLIEESSLGLNAFSRKELLELLSPENSPDGEEEIIETEAEAE